jgi:hypothetical protein
MSQTVVDAKPKKELIHGEKEKNTLFCAVPLSCSNIHTKTHMHVKGVMRRGIIL